MKKVLFLCIGNSIRSQMAEGFARKYGSDVIQASSAGFSPASIIQPLTRKVMEEKNITLDDHFPKEISAVPAGSFDIIVNISGKKLPTKMAAEVREWTVDDPMGRTEDHYIIAREQIEQLVMRLILDLRKSSRPASAAPAPRVPRPVRSN